MGHTLSDKEIRAAVDCLRGQEPHGEIGFYVSAKRTLSNRYRGKGRPRESDYDLSINDELEIIRD